MYTVFYKNKWLKSDILSEKYATVFLFFLGE